MFVLLAVRVTLLEMVMLVVKVALQTGWHRDELLLKFRWLKPDSVVKMVGRKKMAIREVRRTTVLIRVERLSRPRP